MAQNPPGVGGNSEPIKSNIARHFGHRGRRLGCETTNQQAKLNIILFPKTQVPELVEELVSGHPFLAGLNPSELRFFFQCASFRCFEEGQEIFHEGGQSEHFYLIESGQVALETFVPGRGMARIETLGPGEALGWAWLFAPHQWHFSARATNRTEVLVFEAEYLREQARQNRDFYYELVIRLARVLAGRLEGIREQLIDVYRMRP